MVGDGQGQQIALLSRDRRDQTLAPTGVSNQPYLMKTPFEKSIVQWENRLRDGRAKQEGRDRLASNLAAPRDIIGAGVGVVKGVLGTAVGIVGTVVEGGVR